MVYKIAGESSFKIVFSRVLTYLRCCEEHIEGNNTVKKAPILEDSNVSEAEIFDLPNWKGKQISIKCPSSPTTYIYLEKFDADTMVVRILI